MRVKRNLRIRNLIYPVAMPSSERGFTLIELLVSVVLTSIIMGAVYSVYRVQMHQGKVQEQRLVAQEYGRTVLDMMVREIRNAGYDPLGTCAAGVVTAESQKIRFSYDSNGDGDCNDENENIEYRYDAGTCSGSLGNIMRKTYNAPTTDEALTDCNVPSADFSLNYYPKDSTTAYATPVASGSLGSIQRVSITLKVRTKFTDAEFAGSSSSGANNPTMTSNADLRNRGL